MEGGDTGGDIDDVLGGLDAGEVGVECVVGHAEDATLPRLQDATVLNAQL